MSALPLSPGTTAPAERKALWGRDVRELHDTLWAADGVQIVRPGGRPVTCDDDAMFLLLGPHDLVSVDAVVLQRMLRGGSTVVHARLERAPSAGASELIVTDQSNSFIRAHRTPSSNRVTAGEALATTSPAVALLWRLCTDPVSGRRAIRLTAGPDGVVHGVLPGRVFDDRQSSDGQRWLAGALKTRSGAAGTLPEVLEARPGVLAHRSSVIDPLARFCGPVWIGAGVHVDSGQAVIGPGVLPDAVTVEPTVHTLRLVRGEDRRTASPPRDRGRRLFDIVFAAAALLVTLPLWPLLMLAIWLEDGRPFFFAHTRQARGGRDFACLKFRTMCRHAEHLKGSLAELNTCDGPQFNLREDPRLLRVGRFMRRFYLDELPQFINVLKGQMSVVGPRPSPERENRFCPAWRDARLSVRPGVTGLWQVCRTRAPDTDFQEWIRYDLHYVEHRSWRLDAWVIMRTIAKLLGARPAVIRTLPDRAPGERSPRRA